MFSVYKEHPEELVVWESENINCKRVTNLILDFEIGCEYFLPSDVAIHVTCDCNNQLIELDLYSMWSKWNDSEKENEYYEDYFLIDLNTETDSIITFLQSFKNKCSDNCQVMATRQKVFAPDVYSVTSKSKQRDILKRERRKIINIKESDQTFCIKKFDDFHPDVVTVENLIECLYSI